MNYRLKALLPQFTKDYLACAAWSDVESDECQEFTTQAQKEAELHCAMFMGAVVYHYGIEKAIDLLSKKANDGGLQAGHDFWLTRNRHGSGFWDREEIYGEESVKLTEISHKLGEINCVHIRGKRSKLIFE